VNKREKKCFNPADFNHFKQQLLLWADGFEVACYLDSNGYRLDQYATYEGLVGVGIKEELTSSIGDAFESLKHFYENKKDWLFGFLTYDLKNEVEALHSNNSDNLQLPDLYFFQPQWVIYLQNQNVFIEGKNPERIFKEITQVQPQAQNAVFSDLHLQQKISKETYISTVQSIKRDIEHGEVYELNFCQEFFAQNAQIAPVHLFQQLNQISPSPFAAYLKLNDKYLLCASPERFLKKEGNTLLSQPIKGTIKRSSNPLLDQQLQHNLQNDPKERAENVMIVDLVRNDLTRASKTGTIKVKELCSIYSFQQVHHLISTIESHLLEDLHFTKALEYAFPMGSMTGCPKIRAMELIEDYEQSKRGLYSGSVGYITPLGDFDFNVVIRSILYHSTQQYLSFQIGGAITYDSTPAQEYEECLLKAKAILQVLSKPKMSKTF